LEPIIDLVMGRCSQLEAGSILVTDGKAEYRVQAAVAAAGNR